MHDLKNNISLVQALAPVVCTADKTATGIDLAGFKTAVVVLNMGVITDGTWALEVQESDAASSGFAAVAAADLIGTEPTGLTTGAGSGGSTVYTIGYKGSKRYIRTVLSQSAAGTGALAGIVVIKGNPDHTP